jgi:O-antigen ligase
VLRLLTVFLVAVVSISAPDRGVWLGLKAFLLEAAGIVLAVYVVSRGEWTRARVFAALSSPTNLAVLAFLAWVGVGAAFAPYPGPARYEAMRQLGGGLIYFAVVYGVALRHQLGSLVILLAAAGAIAAGVGSVRLLQDATADLVGAYRNAQLLAAFLALLMPIVIMQSQADSEPVRRVGALAAGTVMLAGLLLARNRGAWIASLVAAVVLGMLYLLRGRPRDSRALRRDELFAPVLILFVFIWTFCTFFPVSQRLLSRAGTFLELALDQSFETRLGLWEKARRMLADRPLSGHGTGMFPLQQALYFQPGTPLIPQGEILRRGASMAENAHNTYLQMGAELGFPGLALYLGAIGSVLYRVGDAIRRGAPGFRQSILIGITGSLVAHLVTAVGSPAWEFPECSLFLWLVLGLGIAAAELKEDR